MRNRFDTEFFDSPLPRLFAHRGASGDYPENSLPAFDAAARAGVPYIELDIQMTRDSEIVVIHDEDLTRVAGKPGTVAAMTLQELQDYDIGSQSLQTEQSSRFATRASGSRCCVRCSKHSPDPVCYRDQTKSGKSRT